MASALLLQGVILVIGSLLSPWVLPPGTLPGARVPAVTSGPYPRTQTAHP